ncbi:hypothetical protein VTH06DRAFT_2732 [Thermothelomyces fergusii]
MLLLLLLLRAVDLVRPGLSDYEG